MENGFLATSLQEALRFRAEHDCIPYAGGTDLMVENPDHPVFLFIGRVPELKQIREDDTYVRIGAAVTFTEAIDSPLTPALMKEALRRIAAPAIRNAGTFGGNLGNGSAKADTVLIEYVTDAKLVIASANGERTIGVDAFYKGRKELDLAKDELITEILIPKRGTGDWYYRKVGGREALAISRVSFAGICNTEDGRITRMACAFGAVAPTVLRFREIEERLAGKTKQEAAAMREEILRAYDERLQLTEGRVSAQYRKTVCMNLLRDFYDTNGI